MTVSALVHYFTLVAVMWMGAEALFMFQKLVLVFVEITTKYIIIVSVICWGKSQQGFVKPHVAQLDKPLVTVHYCALSLSLMVLLYRPPHVLCDGSSSC